MAIAGVPAFAGVPALALAALTVAALAAAALLPAAPTLGAERSHTLVWRGPGDADLAGFRVHLTIGSLQHGDGRNLQLPPRAPNALYSYTIDGLDDRVSYYAVLTAYDTAGNRSAFSNEVRIAARQPPRCGSMACADPRTPLPPPPSSCSMAFGPPGAASRVWTSDPRRSITVVWTAPRVPQGAQLRYLRQGSQQWTTVAGTPFRATNCTATYVARVEGLDRNSWYWYQVSGAGSGGPIWSALFVADLHDPGGTSLDCADAHGVPSDVTTSHPAGEDFIVVRWSAPLHPDGAELRYARVGRSTFTEVEGSVESSLGCDARYRASTRDLQPGQEYDYQVSASRHGGVVWSALDRFTLEPEPLLSHLVLWAHRPLDPASCFRPRSGGRAVALRDPLAPGDIVDLAELDCECLGIEAMAGNEHVESVRFAHFIDGVQRESLVRNSSRYAFYFSPSQLLCSPGLRTPGFHRLRATPCSVDNDPGESCADADGVQGDPLVVDFTVVGPEAALEAPSRHAARAARSLAALALSPLPLEVLRFPRWRDDGSLALAAAGLALADVEPAASPSATARRSRACGSARHSRAARARPLLERAWQAKEQPPKSTRATTGCEVRFSSCALLWATRAGS